MYCGTNKTALASQEQISNALYALMKEKSYSEISISELCRKAHISRQTFYTLYQSKENIIIKYLQANIYTPNADLSAGQDGPTFKLEDFCLQFSRYLISNKEFLTLLVNNGILHLLFESMYQSMLACDFFLNYLNEKERRYIAAFIASGFSGIGQVYIEQGAVDSEEFLKEQIGSLFRGEYIPD